jgi:hypothetical protein
VQGTRVLQVGHGIIMADRISSSSRGRIGRVGDLSNGGLSHLDVLYSAGNLLHWEIPSCSVQEPWVDILLHWAIPSCPV